ncbi:MAG: uracil-DNA glycosylase [Chitinophagales bacterium]
MAEVAIEESWKKELQDEFDQPYFSQIKAFLLAQKQNGKRIFPPGPLIFNAFQLTPFDKVKVVILGQDPYHGEGQAHGLSFSVPANCKIPPSLQNIYKELYDDLSIPIPDTGNLESWAQQGVLLLNAMLTVNAGEPASHRLAGWEQFTDAVIRHLSAHRTGLVFMLWGKFAQDKAILIDPSKHLILKAPHPSPFSAHTGFFGCRHFSKANAYLKEPINWQLMPAGR